MESLIKAGVTIEAAVAAAAKDLGVGVEQVTYKVLESGSKGFFGLGAKPARVEVTVPSPKKTATVTAGAPTGAAEKMAIDFVCELTQHMGLNVQLEAQKRDRHLYINLSGEDMGILIGKRGQTLDALQYIVNLATPRQEGNDFGVVIDTENYRRRRRDTLEGMARRSAKKVKDTRRPVKLEPMSRFERHVIHTSLQNDKSLRTSSEGAEPNRFVVISLR